MGSFNFICRVALDDLWHHPLLMSPNERYFFPIDAHKTLQDDTRHRCFWKDKYCKSESIIHIEATIAKSKYKKEFKQLYEEANYKDNALGVHEFSRIISLHFQQQNLLVCTSH